MVLTVGEPMGLFVADDIKPLEEVEHFTRYVCGAEVNFSVGMARLGHEMAYVTKIGQDPLGKHIKKFLEQNNIDNRYISFSDDLMTGFQMKARVYEGDPEVVNFRKNTAFSNLKEEDVASIDWQDINHLHVTGIPPALSSSCRRAIHLLMDTAREYGVQISFDTNLRPALWADKGEMVRVINELAAKADIVLPGVSEGAILMGSRSPERIADFYLSQGAKIVVVKTGAEGAYAKNAEGSFVVPAFRVAKVIDTVGAGDGFAVGVISGLLEGLPLHEAVRRGAAVGALAIMTYGDNEGLPTREQLEAFMRLS